VRSAGGGGDATGSSRPHDPAGLRSCRAGPRLFVLAEGVEQGEGDGEDDRAEDDAEDAEDLQAAEDGEEDEELVQLGALADQLGAQEVVDRCR
jgi:hypothetical protein